ncbi:hypothetical protein QZH41_005390 [Actinostola sp. cb2023]|nr:hypothetical protein QZH41_005390 [Actinostola sp. cb2023]
MSAGSEEKKVKKPKYQDALSLRNDWRAAKASGDYKSIQTFLTCTFDSFNDINAVFKKREECLGDEDQDGSFLDHDFVRITYDIVLTLPQEVQKAVLKSIINGLLQDMKRCSELQFYDITNDILCITDAANWLQLPPLMSHTYYYNHSLDHIDLMGEYYSWQNPGNNAGKFSFCQYPFILSLGAKRYVMQKDSESQMIVMARKSLMEKVQRREMPDMGMLFLNIKVRRLNLISDSLNEIARKQKDLKKKLKVTFAGEPGLDMGGLTKEWFLLLIRKIFKPEYGMFTYNEKSRLYWFNQECKDQDEEFNLVGVDLARGLKELLRYEGDVENDLCQTFQVSHTSFGQVITHNLKPKGDTIPVTNHNKQEYVNLYVDYLLNKSMYQQFAAFYHGFHSVCASNALIMLRPEEVEMLVCGNPELDMEALKKVTMYDGYSKSDGPIRYFWEIVLAFSTDLKKKTLLFVTGSDRIPIGGMAEMEFKICKMEALDSTRMLPMAHTCFNQLILPPYKNRKQLKQKLTIAISNAEGFGIE